MKKLIVIVGFLLLASFALTQTNIPAGDVSGTWNLAGSPYIINGEIDLQIGNELGIDPGVEVQFSGYYKFNVYGRLLAEGDSTNAISFTAQNTVVGWHGLRFFDTSANGQDTSRVAYCNFEYGIASGIGTEYQGGALYCASSSDIIIEHTTFTNNTATTGGAIYLNNSSIILNYVTISENEATGAGGGMYLYASNPTITFSTISENTAIFDGGGINCNASSPYLERVEITNNFTEWNGGGISIYNNSNPDLINITISENISYQDGCGIACLYNSDAFLINSIVWNNDSHEIFVASSGEITISYTDIENGSLGILSDPGSVVTLLDGIIETDPEFIDVASGDFHLHSSSPCIDTGSPDPLYNDPDDSRNDMGAWFFHQTGIKGTVNFATGSTGNLEDVLITVSGNASLTTYPNVNGVYFVALEPGTYNVTATLDGYTANPLGYTDIVVTEGSLVSGLDFEMTPLMPGIIAGLANLNGIGSIAEMTISAGDETTNPYFIEEPWPGYWYYELEITPGIWDVTASLAGFQDSTYYQVPVQPNQYTLDIDYILQPIPYIGSIEGTITLKGGTGNVENVEVSADTVTVNPDASGFYQMDVINGTHDVTASLDGYSSVTINDIIVVPGNTVPDVDMVLLPWDVIPGTQYVETVYLTVSLDGKFVDGRESNQFGAFGPGGETDCRGVAVWEEGNHPLWNTEYSYWNLPGYWYLTIISNNNSGEAIEFKLFETETDSVYSCYQSINFLDDEIISLNATVPSPTLTQEFNMGTEWNWISFNTIPSNYLISNIFSSLVPNDIYQVKNQNQSYTYDTVFGWTGDLMFHIPGDGYLVYMLNPVNPFEFSGEAINPTTHTLYLAENYNWVGYYPKTTMPVEDAMISVGANVLLVKNQTQSATNTGVFWVGDLTVMEPGVSYKIQMETEAFLTYPGTAPYGTTNYLAEIPITREHIPEEWEMLTGNKSNMIVMSSIYYDDQKLTDSKKFAVGIFDDNNFCRSIGKAESDFWYFTVVGNDNNDNLHYRILNRENSVELHSSQKFKYAEDTILGNFRDPLRIEFDTETPAIVQSLELYQNHPNPFNPSTVISFNLPKAGIAKLTIYNVKGQQVKELVNTNLEAGNNSMEWNGNNDNGLSASSGIYFYKIEFDGNSAIKKCLMIK